MAGGLSQETANFAFDDSEKIAATEQVAKLSETEMEATKGELNPYGAAAGGITAGAHYTGIALGSSSADWSWSGFGTAVTGGALAGSFYNPGGVAAAASAAYDGAAIGYGTGYIAGSLWD